MTPDNGHAWQFHQARIDYLYRMQNRNPQEKGSRIFEKWGEKGERIGKIKKEGLSLFILTPRHDLAPRKEPSS